MDEILDQAPASMGDESVVLRGVIVRTASPDEFLLQRYPGSRSEYAVFRREDVVGNPSVVPRSAGDAGAVVHAVPIRRWATARAFTERIHVVGDEPFAPAVLDDYCACANGSDEPRSRS